jgi:hypothetical protein
MAVCRVCGKGNADDARYCFSCGGALSQGPPVKVEVKSPLAGFSSMPAAPMVPPIYTPRQSNRPGSCFYHPELPSTYVCSRCGRAICAGCSKAYGVLSFCPECYWSLAPKLGSHNLDQYSQYGQPYPMPYQQEPQRSPFSLF